MRIQKIETVIKKLSI